MGEIAGWSKKKDLALAKKYLRSSAGKQYFNKNTEHFFLEPIWN